MLEAGYCWWTSEVPHVVMIFLVHFSFFLLIFLFKSALACLDGKFFERVFRVIYDYVLI